MQPCGLLKNRLVQNDRIEIIKQLDKKKYNEVLFLLSSYCDGLEPKLKTCVDEYSWKINGLEKKSTCIYFELIMSNVLLVNTIVDNWCFYKTNKNNLLTEAIKACESNLIFCKKAEDFILSTQHILYLTPIYNLDKLDYCRCIKKLHIIQCAEEKNKTPNYTTMMGKLALEAVQDIFYQRHKYTDEYLQLLYYLYTFQARHFISKDEPTKAIALLDHAKPIFKKNIDQAEMFDVLIKTATTNNSLISHHSEVSLNDVVFVKLNTSSKKSFKT